MGPERTSKLIRRKRAAPFQPSADVIIVGHLLKALTSGYSSSKGRFDSTVWNEIVEALGSTGRHSTVRQAQGRFNKVCTKFSLPNLSTNPSRKIKQSYHAMNNLSKEPGFSWDDITHMLVASDEDWRRVVAVRVQILTHKPCSLRSLIAYHCISPTMEKDRSAECLIPKDDLPIIQ